MGLHLRQAPHDSAAGDHDGAQTAAYRNSGHRKRKSDRPEVAKPGKSEKKIDYTDHHPIASGPCPKPGKAGKHKDVVVPVRVRDKDETEKNEKIKHDLRMLFAVAAQHIKIDNPQGGAKGKGHGQNSGKGQIMGRRPPNGMHYIDGPARYVKLLGAGKPVYGRKE